MKKIFLLFAALWIGVAAMTLGNTYAKENMDILTPSQLVSMEMVKNPAWIEMHYAPTTIMLGASAGGESEYANFAIADVNDYVNVRNMPSTHGEIVGKIFVDEIIEDTPKNLWAFCYTQAGINKKDFFKYFEGKDKGYAIKIKKYEIFEKPINPYTENKNFTAPQSYAYLSNILPQLA